MDQVTNVKVQFRPTMKAGVGSQKGKRINTLIADDIEWTYLPSAKGDTYEGDAGEDEGTNNGQGGTDNGGGGFAG